MAAIECIIGERARHSLGVLNTNLQIYMEVRMSPLGTPVKEAEVGHSHFLSQRHGRSSVYTVGYGTGTINVL